MSNLTDHAARELRLAGFFDADSDYNRALGKSVMELVETFAKQGHSGFSAHMAIRLFDQVAKFKTLTPITSDPNEWLDVSEMMGGNPRWQNRRCSSCFSEDGGKTWQDNDKPSRWHRFKRWSRPAWLWMIPTR